MPKRYHIALNLIALSLIVYMGVGLFYSVVNSRLRKPHVRETASAPAAQVTAYQKPATQEYEAITKRNLFGSTDKPAAEEKEVEVVENIEALEPTSLNVTLLGTVTGTPKNAYAVIEEKTNRKQGLFKVGDSIQNAVVKRILRGKVILTVGDKDEILTMDEAGPKAPANNRVASRSSTSKGPGNTRSGTRLPAPRSKPGQTVINVDREDIDESLTNINSLLSQVRIRPHFREGKPDGLAVSKIKSDSIFAKLGLQEGDVVQAVNDQTIRSPDDVLALYKKLRAGSAVAIQIDRNGRSQTINYNFQ
jgi:general secretion pathway protein C